MPWKASWVRLNAVHCEMHFRDGDRFIAVPTDAGMVLFHSPRYATNDILDQLYALPDDLRTTVVNVLQAAAVAATCEVVSELSCLDAAIVVNVLAAAMAEAAHRSRLCQSTRRGITCGLLVGHPGKCSYAAICEADLIARVIAMRDEQRQRQQVIDAEADPEAAS